MQDHVIDIKSLWRRIDFKVPPHVEYSPVHSEILPRRNSGEDFLQIRDVVDGDLDGEGVPVEDVAERRDVVVGNQDRNAAGVDGLHDSGAGHFVSAGAEAELALPHHLDVRHPLGEVLVDPNVVVLILPLLDQNGPYWAVEPAGEERQNWPAGRRWAAQKPGYVTRLEIDFREGYVL